MNTILKLMILFMFMNLVKVTAQDKLNLLTSIHGENEGDQFVNVDAIGDINGDGFDDFIIGADGKYIKLYMGSSPFDTLNCVKFENGVWRRVYTAGAGKGDLNGDGYNDFLLSSRYSNSDFRVEVYFGGIELDTTADLTITNNVWYSYFGSRATISGDLNNDGYDDLVISSPNDDYDARGRVYIYFGGAEMDTVCDVYLEGKEGADMFGNSVSIVGDVNDDGFADLLVGAPQDLKGESGTAYLFFGGDSIGFNNSVEFVGDTTLPYSSFGRVVSGLGDINNDRFDDFGILSGKYINIYSGKTLEVFYQIISGEDYWGPTTISNGFDIDKDGYNDFVIGFSHLVDQYAGGVALFLGGNEFEAIPALIINGKTKNSYFGNFLSVCGDINKDGQVEILIGEEGELTQEGIIGNGVVYIYSYGDLSSIKNITTEVSNDFFIQQNYPNPFNPATAIAYTLSKELDITIEVLNITGEKVKTLFSGRQSIGSYKITWDGLDKHNIQVSSGIYLLRFLTKNYNGFNANRQKVIKMVLLK